MLRYCCAHVVATRHVYPRRDATLPRRADNATRDARRATRPSFLLSRSPVHPPPLPSTLPDRKKKSPPHPPTVGAVQIRRHARPPARPELTSPTPSPPRHHLRNCSSSTTSAAPLPPPSPRHLLAPQSPPLPPRRRVQHLRWLGDCESDPFANSNALPPTDNAASFEDHQNTASTSTRTRTSPSRRRAARFAEIDLGAARQHPPVPICVPDPRAAPRHPDLARRAGPLGQVREDGRLLLPYHQRHHEGPPAGRPQRGGGGYAVRAHPLLHQGALHAAANSRKGQEINFRIGLGLEWLLLTEERRLLSRLQESRNKLRAQSKDKETQLGAMRMVMGGKPHQRDRGSCDKEDLLHDITACALLCISCHASVVAHVSLHEKKMFRRLHAEKEAAGEGRTEGTCTASAWRSDAYEAENGRKGKARGR